MDNLECRRFGAATERFVVAVAIEKGFKVAEPIGVPDGDDLYMRFPNCAWVSVQVKSTSSRDKRRKPFRVNLGRTKSTADFHIIRCRNVDGFYIIPTVEMTASKTLVLSPRLDKYRNAWDLLKVPVKEENGRFSKANDS